MRETPLLARLLLRAAQLMTPASERAWVDAMRGDLDAAHDDGRVLWWAIGCLVAALRIRLGRLAVLSPRRRGALIGVCVVLLTTALYSVIYRVVVGDWPFHSFAVFIIFVVPIIIIVGAFGFSRFDIITIYEAWWLRASLACIAIACAGFAFSICSVVISALAGHRLADTWSLLPSLFAVSVAVGALATVLSVALLLQSYRKLPRRIPKHLPFERNLVYFWGAERTQMLARLDAGEPEMTISRAFLISSTALPAMLLIGSVAQVLSHVVAGSDHAPLVGRSVYFEYALGAVLCAANTLYVVAHIRLARRSACEKS